MKTWLLLFFQSTQNAAHYIEAFRYFCIENTFFISYLTTGNLKLLELSMADLAVTFNKNRLSEE